MRGTTVVSSLVLLMALTPLRSQEPESAGPSLTIYPAFHLKFAGSGGKNYLLSSLVIVNVSGADVRDLTLTETFPDHLRPTTAADGIHDYVVRPEGFSETIEGQVYTMRVPLLHRRELIAGFATLNYDGRPSEADIPAAEVEYTAGGERHKESGPVLTLSLTKYTKYSGSLSDFLKRYSGLLVKIPDGGGSDWGFSSLASRVKAKTPIGVVEVDGDAAEGRFSLLSGAPGEMKEILLSWRPAARAKPAGTADEVKKLINDQIVAAADFTLDMDGAEITKGPFARGDAWIFSSRWKDRAPGRLGGGPVKWYVHTDSQKGVQYLLMVRAQGRGAGAGKADTPNPEKEAALMSQLDEFVKSFRPI